MKKYDPFSLIDAMAFSRMHCNDGLTTGQCISIHQYINNRGELSLATWTKINTIMDVMENIKWTKPPIRYDEDRVLWYYDENQEAWLKVSDIK